MGITSQDAIYVFLDPSGNSEVGSDLKITCERLSWKKSLYEGLSSLTVNNIPH